MHFYKKGRDKKILLSAEEEKFIKFTAYDTLIELDVNQLPVLPEFCQVIDSTILIFPMQFVAIQEGHAEDYFIHGGSGIVMYVQETGHYIALYDEQMSPEQIRWTISKMIYLIKSGNLEKRPNVFHYADKGDALECCNSFAYQFTCPDIILNECRFDDANKIIKYCKIPFSYANTKIRLLKMVKTAKSMQFIESILKTNFSNYINNFRKNTDIKSN